MTTGGYMGKILRVDLSSRKATEEKLDESLLKKFGGQIGIGLKMLYDEAPPEVKATDPENRLIFITGPFTGTRVQSPSNFAVISKDRARHNCFGVGNSHGFWGPRLKFAGYDGIIVQGFADRPVYLWVHDGECEIRDASHIWGKADTFETEDIIKEEVGQGRAAVVAIGPGGEHLCDGALIENDHGHVAANGNVGIVMGSKYLKAIAVYGTGKVPVANADEFKSLSKKWREESSDMPFGTAGVIPGIYGLGRLPVKNLTTCVFPEYERISGQYMRATYEMKRNPCYGCSLTHCQMMTITEGPYKGKEFEEPEFENMSNLGPNIGLSDAPTIAWLTDYVDRLGIDSNNLGSVVSWAMEAYERGILTKEALGGLELHWGDEKAAAELCRRVAYREGIGDILALGLKKGPEKIGGEEAAAFAVHFKESSYKGIDCRSAWAIFLGLCIAGRGPGWESIGVDDGADPELGYEERLDPYIAEGKAEAARKTQMKKLFIETLGICWMGSATMDTMVKAYTALTGWHLSIDEALLIGERIANVQRAFNVRHGFKPKMDLDVSPRLLEPPPDGAAKGKTIAPYLEGMIREYNQVMDWDWETGRPSRSKLGQLGLDDVAKDLWG